jgi:hypothetical protein
MKFWENFSSFESANAAWDKKQASLENILSLKKVLFEQKNKLKFSNFIRIKSLFYLIRQDKRLKLLKFFLKKPIINSYNLFRSYLSKEPYIKEKDFFLFNLSNLNELKQLALENSSLFVFGFSYCQKPFECPQKRFSSQCLHDYNNNICSQCFIGKCTNAMNNKDIFLVITDIYHFAKKILELINKNPNKKIIFIITSCELSVKMFSDFANVLKIKALSIKLTKKVCLNYKSFLTAEKGKKSVITDLDKEKKILFLELLKLRYVSKKDSE